MRGTDPIYSTWVYPNSFFASYTDLSNKTDVNTYVLLFLVCNLLSIITNRITYLFEEET